MPEGKGIKLQIQGTNPMKRHSQILPSNANNKHNILMTNRWIHMNQVQQLQVLKSRY